MKFHQSNMAIPFRRINPPSEWCWEPLFVLPAVECDWLGGLSPEKNVERIQSRAIYAMAASVVLDDNPTNIERTIFGELYSTQNRLRLFERLEKGNYRVLKSLERGEKRFLTALEKMEELGGAIEAILNWEFWSILSRRDMPLSRQAEESAFIEAICSYHVPQPPDGDISDAARYLSELFPRSIDALDHLMMATHCLHLAEATGNLGQYVLTYEGLFNRFCRDSLDCFEAMIWWEVLAHLNRWFRVLVLIPWNREERADQLFAKCTELERLGIHVRGDGQENELKVTRFYPVAPIRPNIFPAVKLPPANDVVGNILREQIRRNREMTQPIDEC